MIAHVVLFRPKAALSGVERRALIDALEHALNNISLIKRAQVGRRFLVGRQYDGENRADFPFAAILEFETANDLREYLDHPAHRGLGEQFYAAADAALVFDYELLDSTRTGELLTS